MLPLEELQAAPVFPKREPQLPVWKLQHLFPKRDQMAGMLPLEEMQFLLQDLQPAARAPTGGAGDMHAFRCRRCQTELRPNAKFCDVCGHASPSETAHPNLDQCSRLGATVTGPTGPSHRHDGFMYPIDAARVSAPGCSTPTTSHHNFGLGHVFIRKR